MPIVVKEPFPAPKHANGERPPEVRSGLENESAVFLQPRKTPLEVMDAFIDHASAQPPGSRIRDWNLSADTVAAGEEKAREALQGFAAGIAGNSVRCLPPEATDGSILNKTEQEARENPAIGRQPQGPLVRPDPIARQEPAPTLPAATRPAGLSLWKISFLLSALAGAILCFLARTEPPEGLALLQVDQNKFWQSVGITIPTDKDQAAYARTLETISREKNAIVHDDRGVTIAPQHFSSFSDATPDAIALWQTP